MLPNFQLITRQLNPSQTITNGISRRIIPESLLLLLYYLTSPLSSLSSTTRSVLCICPPDHPLPPRINCNLFTDSLSHELLLYCHNIATMTKCGCWVLACSGYSNLKAIGAHGNTNQFPIQKIRPRRRPLIERPSWFCNRFPCTSGRPTTRTRHERKFLYTRRTYEAN